MSNQRKQQPEKISADCPHCGFSQLESAYAKSTICRHCSQPYSIEKLLAKEVASLKAPSLFNRLSKMISRETVRQVRCFSCQATQQVSTSAESSLCPKCGSYIDLRDFKITGPFGRSIQTQGDVVISSKGDATSQRILCGKAWIQGKMRGQMLCTDTVYVKMEGKLVGSIESEKVVVERKSEIEFVRPLIARSVEINGKASGEIVCDGRVTINSRGDLSGIVRARSIVIEKGGIFSGELHIGVPPEEAESGANDAAADKVTPLPAEVSSSASPKPATAHLPGFEPKPGQKPPPQRPPPGMPRKVPAK